MVRDFCGADRGRGGSRHGNNLWIGCDRPRHGEQISLGVFNPARRDMGQTM